MHIKICQRWHVGLHGFCWPGDTLQFVTFVLLVGLLYPRFSSFKRYFCSALPGTGVAILINDCFASWAQRLAWSDSLLTLLSDVPEPKDSYILLAENEHILATGKPFKRFSLWIFKLLILIVSGVLLFTIYQFQTVCYHGHLCPEMQLTRFNALYE